MSNSSVSAAALEADGLCPDPLLDLEISWNTQVNMY